MYGDFINYAAIQETMQSYDKAIQQMFALCKNAKPTPNNWQDAMPTNWSVACSTLRREEMMPHISELFSRVRELTEYGRPKTHVGNHTRLLEITAYASFSFKVASVRCAIAGHPSYIDDDGNFHSAQERQPQIIGYEEKQIRLQLFEKVWTVENWKKFPDSMIQFMALAPERIQTRFVKEVANAEAEIGKYNQLIQKLQTI